MKGDKWEVEQEYNFFACEDKKCTYLFPSAFLDRQRYFMPCSLPLLFG